MKYKLLLLTAAFIGIFACSSDKSSKVDEAREKIASGEVEKPMAEEAMATGEKLYTLNCAACHRIDGRLIGPGLKGSLETWGGDKEALYLWTRNWQEAVDEGIPRAVEIQDFSPTAMTMFPKLTDEDLDKIYAYIEK